MTYEETDIARLAAFIDGEGSIVINRAKRNYGSGIYHQLHLNVANTDARLPLWCREKFGGTVRVIEVGGKRKLNVYVWHVTAKNAGNILSLCLPYFVIKREQAIVAIEFRKTMGRRGTRVTHEQEIRRQEHREELQRLHREPVGHDRNILEDRGA